MTHSPNNCPTVGVRKAYIVKHENFLSKTTMIDGMCPSSSNNLTYFFKIFSLGQKWPHAGEELEGWADANIFFSECDHITNQIKVNEAYNSILANSLPLLQPLTRGVGTKGQLLSFPESSHAAYQNDGNEAC